MGIEIEATEAPPRRSLLRRIAVMSGWVGAVTLAGATAYLAVMAVMWYLQVGELEGIKQDLAGQLADDESALAGVTTTLEASRQELNDTLASIIGSADDKAQAQDNQLLFEDIAIVMADCADETGILVGYTYDRAIYVYWSIKEYENSVRAYCNEVSAALSDLIAETEGEGS